MLIDFLVKFRNVSLVFSLVSSLAISDVMATEKNEEKNENIIEIKKEEIKTNELPKFLGDCWQKPKPLSSKQLLKFFDINQSYSTLDVPEKSQKRVLVCCGGGVRGYLEVFMLAEFEKKTKLSIVELFDECSGVSTGALTTALALVPEKEGSKKPKYTANQGVQLYEEAAKEAFGTTNYYSYLNPQALRGPRYSPKPLENILKKYIGDLPFDQLLLETTIFTVNFAKKKQRRVGFNSKIARTLEKKYLTRDILMATTAAPTFFPTYDIDGEPHGDGGLYANDSTSPILFKVFEEEGVLPFAVTLGTGDILKEGLTLEDGKTQGALSWISTVLETCMENEALTDVTDLFKEIFNSNGKQNHYVINPEIPFKNSRLDDASPENIQALKKIALTWIENNTKTVDEICNRLVKIKDEKEKYEKFIKDEKDEKKE